MNKTSQIDTIIFDAGKVLVYISEFRCEVIKRVLKSAGYDDTKIKEALDAGIQFDQEYFSMHEAISTWDDEKKWLEKRAKVIANVIEEGNSELSDKLQYLAFDTFQYKLYDETIGVLERLKEKYSLSVLSNATASLDWAFDYLDIRKYFDEVIISSYEKCEKPDTRLYQIALNRLNVSAEQCIFIDDRIENVNAAIDVGMQAYHLDRKAGNTLLDFEKYLVNMGERK